MRVNESTLAHWYLRPITIRQIPAHCQWFSGSYSSLHHQFFLGNYYYNLGLPFYNSLCKFSSMSVASFSLISYIHFIYLMAKASNSRYTRGHVFVHVSRSKCIIFTIIKYLTPTRMYLLRNDQGSYYIRNLRKDN